VKKVFKDHSTKKICEGKLFSFAKLNPRENLYFYGSVKYYYYVIIVGVIIQI